MIIVDTHPHLLAADNFRYPIDPIGGVQSDWSKDTSLSGAELVERMDAAEVHQSVIVQSSTIYGHDNSFVADEVARFPGRLVGIGSVDALADDAPDKLSYWILDRGLAGIRLFLVGSTMSHSSWFDDLAMDPFWKRAIELNISVCAQLRFDGREMLRNVLERYPEVVILLDHAGAPPIEDGPPYKQAQEFFDLARYPNLVLKITNHTIDRARVGAATPESFIERLVETYGSDRIMWGSNFPNAVGEGSDPYKALVDEIVECLAPLDEADQAAILGGTAVRVYPKLAAS